MLSVTGPAGFYKTPVNKVILGASLMSSLALMFPLQHHRHLCSYSYHQVVERGEWWRLLTSKLAFLDIKDVALCAMLIYNFRFLERRFGSRKYVSYLLAVSVLATVLELSVLVVCRRLDITFSLLPSGPFCLVFPQFVQFFLMIPRVAASTIMGVPVTGKPSLTSWACRYSGTGEYRLVTLCAVMAGLLWHQNFLKVQSLVVVPEFVSRACEGVGGWLLQSSPPSHLDGPMGATLELQRQERLERMEEQMVAAALRSSAPRTDLLRPQPFNMANGPGIFGNFLRHGAFAGAGRQVQRLIEMGFSDDSVRRALRLTNNDISQATTVLLQEAS